MKFRLNFVLRVRRKVDKIPHFLNKIYVNDRKSIFPRKNLDFFYWK